MKFIDSVHALVGASLSDPLQQKYKNLSDVFGFFLNALLGIGMGIAFISLILAVIKYVNSSGDPKEASGAQKSLLFTFIGMGIMIFIVMLKTAGENLLGVSWRGSTGITNFIR